MCVEERLERQSEASEGWGARQTTMAAQNWFRGQSHLVGMRCRALLLFQNCSFRLVNASCASLCWLARPRGRREIPTCLRSQVQRELSKNRKNRSDKVVWSLRRRPRSEWGIIHKLHPGEARGNNSRTEQERASDRDNQLIFTWRHEIILNSEYINMFVIDPACKGNSRWGGRPPRRP